MRHVESNVEPCWHRLYFEWPTWVHPNPFFVALFQHLAGTYLYFILRAFPFVATHVFPWDSTEKVVELTSVLVSLFPDVASSDDTTAALSIVAVSV